MKKQHLFSVRIFVFLVLAFVATVFTIPTPVLGGVYFDTGDIAIDGSFPSDGDSMGSYGWTITGGDCRYSDDNPYDGILGLEARTTALQGHSGSSFALGPEKYGESVSFWLYDYGDTYHDNGCPCVKTMTCYEDAACTSRVGGIGISAHEPCSATKYCYYDAEPHPTTVSRTNGWHFFKVEFTGSEKRWYIDGVLVAQKASTAQFKAVELNCCDTCDNHAHYDNVVINYSILLPVDIKPGSCPNPINVKSKGVLPTEILGTEDFDVTMVDPASVRLEGVAPLRSALEDIATPFEPFAGKEDELDCTDLGPDGYIDLTLKFDTQEIVDAIGDVEDGDVVVLTLSGNLKDEFGGTPIQGEDVVVILKKGKK